MERAGSLVTVVALGVSMQQLADVTFRFPNGALYQTMTFGLLATGAVGSLIAAVRLWRHARTRLGSLRDALAA